jgi:dTDP-4-amino-4,6-dideoxygalactose transaminase
MSDRIPLIEPVVGDAELEQIEAVIESRYLTQGPVTEQFESEVAERVGTNHAVAVTSCTVGLELTLQAFGIGEGDEVLIPDFTYPATGTAVTRVGANPILVDVNQETYNVDPRAVREAITNRTAAVLPVSWGGRPLESEPFREIGSEFDLPIIEDAACSLGSRFAGDPVGSQFDASVFSFHPRKPITTGEGGVITTDDNDIASKLNSIKYFGTEQRGDEIAFANADATNAKLSDLLSAVGLAQLEKFDEILYRRRSLGEHYTELLSDIDGVRPPNERDRSYWNYQSYSVLMMNADSDRRDAIIERLSKAGIESQIGTYALHRTEVFEDAKRSGELRSAGSLYESLLTLPLADSMTDSDQKQVVDALESAMSE